MLKVSFRLSKRVRSVTNSNCNTYESFLDNLITGDEAAAIFLEQLSCDEELHLLGLIARCIIEQKVTSLIFLHRVAELYYL